MENIIKIKKELQRIGFIDHTFSVIEKHYIPKQFNDAYESNETLNEFYSLEESNQRGVQLTAQISHCFNSFFKYKANDYFIETDSFLRVITTRDSGVKKSYDLILHDIDTDENIMVEIKLSQNKNSWQGSTSTTSKVDNFLLINFVIDRDVKLCSGVNLFKGIFAAIINMKDDHWCGEVKNNNHRTKFDFRVDKWCIDNLRSNYIIKGDVVPKQKIIHLSLEHTR